LTADKKYTWLKNLVENPESKFKDTEYGSSVSGRDSFTVRALARAYKDSSQNVRDYAREKLEKLVLTEKSALISKDTIQKFIEELVYLQELPQPFAVTEETFKETSTTLKSFLFNWGGNI
jgi:hypothetical protein